MTYIYRKGEDKFALIEWRIGAKLKKSRGY
jgi:hypothetical protein